MSKKPDVRNNTRNLRNLEFARSLRKDPSYSEKVLWASLRGERLGFKFRRQVPVGKYVLDFYCAEAMVCVELDGEQHRDRSDQDVSRDAYLARQAIQTFRIPSLSLFDGATYERALKELVALLEARTGRPRKAKTPIP